MDSGIVAGTHLGMTITHISVIIGPVMALVVIMAGMADLIMAIIAIIIQYTTEDIMLQIPEELFIPEPVELLKIPVVQPVVEELQMLVIPVPASILQEQD